jgi:hypothetical protein
VLLQNAASPRSPVGPLGAAALLAWVALALQLTGIFSFDALHPASLAGCASHAIPTGTTPDGKVIDGPFGVTLGIKLRRGDQTVFVGRGAQVQADDGRRYTLVGLDPQARLVVVHDRRQGLLSLPLSGYTLDVKKLRRGRTAMIVVSSVAGAVGGAVAGLAIGVASSNSANSTGPAFGGCIIGLVSGGALGAGTTVAATIDRSYVLAPNEWQVDESRR